MPSTSKHGTSRGLPTKEVLEYLLPELDLSCLRLALNTPKVTEQLMKLDEQGVNSLFVKRLQNQSFSKCFSEILGKFCFASSCVLFSVRMKRFVFFPPLFLS